MAKARGQSSVEAETGPDPKALAVGRALSGVVVVIGALLLLLGFGVGTGRITDGWGFPMSAVPNWGRPWGLALIAFGLAYVLGPGFFFRNPRRGYVPMLLVSGFSILLGTPVFTSAVEIACNLGRTNKIRPDWVDAVWAYYMILHVSICIALCRSARQNHQDTKAPRAEKVA
jgi:hypothetical protein